MTRPRPRPRPAARPRRPAAETAQRRRRGRMLVLAAATFAAVVLVTSFPAGALLRQRAALRTTGAALAQERASNGRLTAAAAQLRQPATIEAIARQDYGLVPAGVRAYTVLPGAGSSDSAGVDTGHVPLDPPLYDPGSASASARLGLGVPGASQATSPVAPSRRGSGTDFWRRVLDALEFWH